MGILVQVARADEPVYHGGSLSSRQMVDLTSQLPSMLSDRARWERRGTSAIPVMIAHPDWDTNVRVPIVLWMHSRTLNCDPYNCCL